MDSRVMVFGLEEMVSTVVRLTSLNQQIGEQCDAALNQMDKVLEDCEKELRTSEMLLNGAKAEETVKLGLQLKADARMTQALAAEASAISSGNPILIASAAAELAEAGRELTETWEAYQKARQHRERLEERYEKAQRCVQIAQDSRDLLSARLTYSRARLTETFEKGKGRLLQAHDDLEKYLSRIAPVALSEVRRFYSYSPKEKTPVTPKEVHDRLNVSPSVSDATLEYLYCTDPKFHFSVDRLCAQLADPLNVSAVENKIRKNIVGRLCEELVIRSFLPMGERVETQAVYYLADGSYTKADMILYGLKEPLILGRGPGMGAPKGGNLGIEVKSGKKEYLFSQLEHMEKQAKGHTKCDISCTVCTRDITDLPPEKENLLRDRLRTAGSPLLGMLPYKEELDRACISFVKSKAEKKNV
ncbi:MAG: hypothetical protein LUH14_10710 [Clostridiaceae bacterium]|nr:hypothetical protein [Clostridiaceae bacterium]